jgi:hypothetical protein
MNMMGRMFFIVVAAVVVNALPLRASAALPLRKMPCTTLTSLPFDITSPGRYCLAADQVTPSFYGIRINASDVELDCAGHAITPTTRSAGSDGVSSDWGLKNIAVKNCTIKDFDRGIRVGYEGSNVTIWNNHVDGSISSGIEAWGNGTRVVGNRVTNTYNAPGQLANGIHLLPFNPSTSATGQVAMNNVVAEIGSDTTVAGFIVSGSSAPQLVNNQVIDLQGIGNVFGIWLSDFAQGASTTNATLINNTMVSRLPNAIAVYFGVPATCYGNTIVGFGSGALDACVTKRDNIVVQ